MTATVEVVQVRVQSAVMLSIFEQYQRRSENCPARLVGAILGSVAPVSEDAAADAQQQHQFIAKIRHAFPVPHSEFGEQVSINSDYYRTRMELHRKCYGKDSVLLGWYSIQQEGALPKNMDAATFAKNAEFIRESFARETGSTGAPVTLNLAITIGNDGKIKHEVLRCESITLRTAAGAARAPLAVVPSQIALGVPDLYTLDSVIKKLVQDDAKVEDGRALVTPPTLAAHRADGEGRVESRLAVLKQYLEDVRSGKRKEDPAFTAQANRILSAVGMTESGAEAMALLRSQKETLAQAVADLERELSRADQLLLSQPYTA